jgi:hypothetical protein
MTESEQKSIGRLEGKMDMVISGLESLTTEVGNLKTQGCVKGGANEEKIEDLDTRTGKLEGLVWKAIVVGLLTAGGGAGGIEIIKFFF